MRQVELANGVAILEPRDRKRSREAVDDVVVVVLPGVGVLVVVRGIAPLETQRSWLARCL